MFLMTECSIAPFIFFVLILKETYQLTPGKMTFDEAIKRRERRNFNYNER